jgi:hypothetical protein
VELSLPVGVSVSVKEGEEGGGKRNDEKDARLLGEDRRGC